MTFYDDVREFHKLFDDVPQDPFPKSDTVRLREWRIRSGRNANWPLTDRHWSQRVRLISEEFAELCKAHAFRNLPEFADGLVDLTWVVLGTAVVARLPFNELWEEVKRANMAKEGGKLDASGKLLKPPGWKPPDIESVLEAAKR